MDLNKRAAALAEWHQSYRPKRSRSIPFLFAHMGEEVAESFREWREGRTQEYTSTDKHGLEKPEGLGAELADVIHDALICAALNDINIEKAMKRKYKYLLAKDALKAGGRRKRKT